ncbi:unnamed protein product [Parascedosporium putredinis]|uniref:Uncharacterized protein n=1 Tax=Parascedosporium putredinis TaxID=1442378 RepID=A0A9P1M7N0_9PEZI|nr:unnamed protein product [Parascedosporium putredinis]CAI7991981.1 unnamed protein product [Parascedosporium putredinis]
MTSCAASRMDKAVPYQVSRTTIFHGQNLRYCRHVFLTGGAIMLKLGIAPIARPTVAPASYGIMVSAPMDPVRDNNKPWYVDVLSQEHRCNIMEWFMSYRLTLISFGNDFQGQDIVRGRKIRVQQSQNFPYLDSNRTIHKDLHKWIQFPDEPVHYDALGRNP